MSTRKQDWQDRPLLSHLRGEMKEKMEERRRLRQIRYWLFRIQTEVENGKGLGDIPNPLPGFMEFWLGEKPVYAVDPRNHKMPVPTNRQVRVEKMGGFNTFAKLWDVDHDLNVFIRHSSVWHEWNSTLMRVVPVLGE